MMNEPKSCLELGISDTERADIWKKLTERRLSKIPPQSHALFFEEEVNDVPAAFCELDQYVITDKKENIGQWQESTRWVKFQEVLDEEGKRWSKPHVPVISANALFQLKEYFYYGSVFFDVHAESIIDVVDLFITELTKTGQLKDENGPLIRQLLLRREAKNSSTTKNGKEQSKSSNKETELLLNQRTRKENKRLHKKLPEDVEATNILVGNVDFLDKPFIAFARLRESKVLGNLTEIDIPTKFIFIALAPKKGDLNAVEVGRALGTIMSDELFRRIIYRTNANEDLKVAISEYIHNATILPPCSLDPQTRIEPVVIVTEEKRKDKVKHLIFNLGEETDDAIIFDHFEDPSLVWTGRFAGGLISDIKRKAKWYLSDFTDGLNIESVSTFCFMYFALLSPIVTFGGLLEEATQKRMAAMENLFSGAICGIIYHLCSGQPLTIIGSTGPVLVFETIVFEMCTEFGWDYLSFRTWINFWTALFLLIITLTDSSASVKFITRFTEESFAALIAFIFIYEAFAKLIKIKDNLQVAAFGGDCQCMLNEGNITGNISDCTLNSGTYSGDGCYVLYDKFLMSIILMFGTFVLSIALKKMRLSGYLPTRIREIVSDFAVIISIALMTSVDIYVGINTPKLTMPSTFTPTYSGRGWFIPPFGPNPYYTAPIAALPAVLACILIFLDQQITAVIVNRKEYKLKKGSGYHLDLFVLSLLILITGYLGLPIYVAATVLSINHVTSLKVETEASAPGEPQQFLGVREQRLTGVMTFILIGVSVFMSKILCYIPMPVLYGVFLYMGINALGTLDFFERICLLLMPMKYQPDRQYIRHVPIKIIHFFTFFQIICLGMLWAVKSIKQISILFPIMLLLMIFVRKFMEFVFSPKHLSYLDTPMPNLCGKKEEDDDEIDDISSESSVEAFPQDKRKKYPFIYDSSKITRESSMVDETIKKNG